MGDLITLTAQNESFKVPREILVKSSLYFHAALESGMTESTSCQFIFPNLSAHQLAMVVRFSHTDLSSWSDSTSGSMQSNIGGSSSCPVQNSLVEALELAEAADYLQMPTLIQTCINRLSCILDRLFDPDSVTQHQEHNCDAFATCLLEFVMLTECDQISLRKLFCDYALRHPHLFFKPILSVDCQTQHKIIDFAIAYLSSNLLCVPSEDIVLDIVLDWFKIIEISSYDLITMKCLLQSIRPGLLSASGQLRLLEFWCSTFPEFSWYERITVNDMITLFHSIPFGGTFSHPDIEFEEFPMFFTPRADTPCLLSLASNRSSNTLDLWCFNLHNGSYHHFPLSRLCMDRLLLDSSGLCDLDRRVYLCHAPNTFDAKQSTVFLFSFDSASGSLNGFAWCLATCQAKMIPRLFLSSTDSKTLGFPTTTCFRSRRIGLSFLSSGLHVYFVTSLSTATWLYVFRFDTNKWCWYEYTPHSIFPNYNGVMLFTPVEQLNTFPQNDWLYANVESVSRSRSHNIMHRRHGLHHASSLRSHFFRFRPKADGKILEVEILPNAPFLIRIYRLLAIESKLNDESKHHCYLFAMGTCSRDQQATQYCFDVNSRKWTRWSTYDQPSAQTTTNPENLQVNLCTKVLGFRGLICATNLSRYLQKSETVLDPQTIRLGYSCTTTYPFSKSDQSEHHHQQQQQQQCSTKTVLVLAGRPDQNKQAPSGIWLHHPQLCSNETFGPKFNPQKPRFFLPTAIAQALGQFSSTSVVTLTNWTHLTHSENPIRFPNDDNDKALEHSDVNMFNQNSPIASSSSSFTCMGYPWSWTACDSD